MLLDRFAVKSDRHQGLALKAREKNQSYQETHVLVVTSPGSQAFRLTSTSSPVSMCGGTARFCTSATLCKNSVWIGHFRLGRFPVLATAKTEGRAH